MEVQRRHLICFGSVTKCLQTTRIILQRPSVVCVTFYVNFCQRWGGTYITFVLHQLLQPFLSALFLFIVLVCGVVLSIYHYHPVALSQLRLTFLKPPYSDTIGSSGKEENTSHAARGQEEALASKFDVDHNRESRDGQIGVSGSPTRHNGNDHTEEHNTLTKKSAADINPSNQTLPTSSSDSDFTQNEPGNGTVSNSSSKDKVKKDRNMLPLSLFILIKIHYFVVVVVQIFCFFNLND